MIHIKYPFDIAIDLIICIPWLQSETLKHLVTYNPICE